MLGEWRLWFWLTDHNGPVTLHAGLHTLYVQAREDGVRIDQFCLLPEGSPAPRGALNAGLDPPALAPDDVQVVLSRESDVVDSHGRLRAAVRVLRCGGAEVDGILELHAEDGKLDCPGRLPVKLDGSERVFVKDITLQFAPDAPCRERVLSAEFIPAGGGQARTARLVITKPWPWLLAGPFAAPRKVDALLRDPAAKWQSFPPERIFNRYGTMDFERVLGNGAHGRMFLKARIRCDEAGTLLWLLNSDDNSAVWLDGKRAIVNPRHAPAEGFLTRARIALAAGEHVIVAAVGQSAFPEGHIYNGTQNYWLFRLRIRREEHVPAPIVGLPWDAASAEDQARIMEQF